MQRRMVCLWVLAFTTAAIAADPPKPQLFLVHEETAMPSMITQYESATKDLIKAFAEKKVTSPSFMVRK